MVQETTMIPKGYIRRPAKPPKPKIITRMVCIMLLMRLEVNHKCIVDINSSTVQHGPLLRAPEQCIVSETSTKTTSIPPNGQMKGYEHHQPCPRKMQVAQAKRWNTPGASQHNGTTQAAHQLQRRSIRPSMCIPPRQHTCPKPS